MDMATAYGVSGGDEAAESRALGEHVVLVRRVVRQLSGQAGGVMEREDMEQIGLLALLEALRRYGEPDERFPGYAVLRIRGAILDELRRLDWRPRSVRQDAHRIRDGVRALTRSLGREPTDAEVMQSLGLDDAGWQAYLLASNAESLASFDALIEWQEQAGAAGSDPAEQWQNRRSLEQALVVLDEREQRVIQLYYEFELNLREIAAVLSLTEARVCQINRRALDKMKTFLQADGSAG